VVPEAEPPEAAADPAALDEDPVADDAHPLAPTQIAAAINAARSLFNLFLILLPPFNVLSIFNSKGDENSIFIRKV
jgi:hypothetical protein